jgi:hypothetical protein
VESHVGVVGVTRLGRLNDILGRQPSVSAATTICRGSGLGDTAAKTLMGNSSASGKAGWRRRGLILTILCSPCHDSRPLSHQPLSSQNPDLQNPASNHEIARRSTILLPDHCSQTNSLRSEAV